MVVEEGDFMSPEVHLPQEFPNARERKSWSEEESKTSIIVIPEAKVEWKNTFHMRQMTLSNLANGGAGQVRQTLSAQAAGTKLGARYSCMTSASRSLDILRLNLQSSVNQELDAVLRKFLQKFFQPAINNIRRNLGEDSITEEIIHMMCRQMLEDAKAQYYCGARSRGCSPFSDSELGMTPDSRFSRVSNKKRREAESEPEASQSVSRGRSKKAMRTVTNVLSGVPGMPAFSMPIKVMKLEGIRREGPKWDPNRITQSTLFIMGARANKVLGFGQTRGRLYTKHPELLKYSGDTEDKEWLSRNNLMPPTGGIAYLLLLEDVKELAESDEYRHNPNVLLHELQGFQAPPFMLNKIHAFISEARTDVKQEMKDEPMTGVKEEQAENVKEAVKEGPVGDVTAPRTFDYLMDSSNNGTRYQLNMDCASVIMTPPASALGPAPGSLDVLHFTSHGGLLENMVYSEPMHSSLLEDVSQNVQHPTVE